MTTEAAEASNEAFAQVSGKEVHHTLQLSSVDQQLAKTDTIQQHLLSCAVFVLDYSLVTTVCRSYRPYTIHLS